MAKPPLWARLHGTHVVRPAVVYLGAAWVVLQVTETLQGLLSLPPWVGVSTVVLMLLGLVVVVATAWVQALPETTAAEEAGELPSEWELAPSDALGSLRRGQIPHLTWARALLGGAVALSLLFGVAGTVVLVRGPGSLVGPRAVGATPAADGIAVLPFHVNGEGLDLYREGMVDLVSANLDGLSLYRAIDARTVLARWNGAFGDAPEVELEQALEVASGTGARYALVGSGFGAGSRVRLTAQVYDLADGSAVGGGGRVEGDMEDVLALVDGLTVEVMSSLLDERTDGSSADAFRRAALLTASVPALRHYLRGDAALRRGRFDEARDELTLAVEEDSTFALAYWRLGEAIGWVEGLGDPDALASKRRAQELRDRLPQREATLVEFGFAVAERRVSAEALDMRAYLRRYPDDPDGWYLLGEAGLHSWGTNGITDPEVEQALYRAVELDPTFRPYYEHALQWASAKGDADAFDRLMAGAESAGDAPERLDLMRLRWALLQGDDRERAAAVARTRTMSAEDLGRADQLALGLVDVHPERLVPLWSVRRDRVQQESLLEEQRGRLAEAVKTVIESGEGEAITPLSKQLERWRLVGSIPDAPLADLDAVLAVPNPALGEARFRLARARGHPVDYAPVRVGFDRAMDATLPMLAAQIDTTGLRGLALAGLEAARFLDAGDPESAFLALSAAVPEAAFPAPDGLFMLGHSAVEARRWDEAILVLEGISRSTLRTLAKFELGRAYEGAGDRARALDAYRTFLSRTVDADPGLGAVEYARAAVTRLGG